MCYTGRYMAESIERGGDNRSDSLLEDPESLRVALWHEANDGAEQAMNARSFEDRFAGYERWYDANTKLGGEYTPEYPKQNIDEFEIDDIIYQNRRREEYEAAQAAAQVESAVMEAADDTITEEGLEVARQSLAEVNKKATVAKKSSVSGWEKSYSGTGERKPGKGMIEGIKGWFKMMFGSGNKK